MFTSRKIHEQVTKNDKISLIKAEIAKARKAMKAGDKSHFKEFIHLQNELNKLLVSELSDKEFETYNDIARRHNKAVFAR